MAITALGAPFNVASYTAQYVDHANIWRIGSGDNGPNFLVTGSPTDIYGGTVTATGSYIYPAFYGSVPSVSVPAILASTSENSAFLDFEVVGVADRIGGGYMAATAIYKDTDSQMRLSFVSSAGVVDATFAPATPAGHSYQLNGLVQLDNGNYLISYTDIILGTNNIADADVYGQIVNGAGAAVGSAFVVNSSSTNASGGGALVALGAGFADVFLNVTPDAFGSVTPNEVRARLFDGNGNPTGADVLLATIPSGTEGDLNIELVSTSNGGFATFWIEHSPEYDYAANNFAPPPEGFTETWSVKSAFVSANGTVLSDATVTSGSRTYSNGQWTGSQSPSISTTDLANGGAALIVTNWGGMGPVSTVYKYTATGASAGIDVLSGSWRSDYTLTEDGRVLALDQSLPGGSTQTLSAQFYDFGVGTSVNGTSGNDTLYGDQNVDDQLIGNGGNDTLIGLSGFDFLRGGLGDDILNGGANDDTADYSTATGSVTLTLTDTVDANGNLLGTATGADGSDTLISIERLRGSNSADIITGNSLANILRGNQGDDIIDGGAGNDWADFSNAAGSVNATLTDTLNAQGKLTGSSSGGPGNDTLLDIENLWGGTVNDILTGNSLDNTLRGGTGNDTINGGAGFDTADYRNATGAITVMLTDTVDVNGNKLGSATGADGNDTLISIERVSGSRFNDVLVGASGNDVFWGRLGNDTIVGAGGGLDWSAYDTATGAVQVTLTDVINGGPLPSLNGPEFLGSSTGADGNDTLIGIENISGSMFDDILIGNSQNNWLRGGKGRDVLNGGAENAQDAMTGAGDWADYKFAETGITVNLSNAALNTGEAAGDTFISIESIRGSRFNDTLVGDAGNNTLRGGNGDDTLNGGLGSDWASYVEATGSVTVTLTNIISGHSGGTSSGADGNDTLIDIESVSGSAFGDTLTGNSSANSIRGDGGNDTINGGAGLDTAMYNNASGAVSVTLTDLVNGHTGGFSSGADGVDTLIDIENLRGSVFNDTLNGNALANVINGDAGDDTITGGAGNDQLTGGTGNDTIFFDRFDSLVDGGDGADIGFYMGVTTSQARAYNMSAHSLETLKWTVSGNAYTMALNNDGTRTETVTDTANTETFISRATKFDVTGAIDWVDTIADTGVRTYLDYDNLNSELWTQQSSVYAANNALDYTDTRFDDGARTFVDYDNLNNQAWSQFTRVYDALGRESLRDTLYDSGVHVSIDSDEASTQAWTQITSTYDAANVLDVTDTKHDNGTRVIVDYDNLNNQTWSQFTRTLDALGREDTREYVYDNGGRQVTDYDQAATQTWTRMIDTYDTLNRLDTKDYRNDDGSRQFVDYDQSSAYSWTQWQKDYNTSGVLVHQTITYDNGTIVNI